MKPIVALDLSLFAVPNTAKTSDEVQDILARIRAWASLIDRQNCIDFATVSNAVDVLQSANCYPATQNIRALLEMHNLDRVFSPNDLNTRIFSMLQKARRLPDVIELETVELRSFEMEGTDTSSAPDLAILKSWALLLASIAACDPSEMVRASTAFESEGEVTIKAEISKLDDGQAIADVDLHIEGQIKVVGWPADLLGSFAAQDVWKNAVDAIQLHLAITIEACRMIGINCSSVPLDGVPSFKIGSEFFEIAQKHGAVSAETLGNLVRTKCAQVLVSRAQAEPKAFGEERASDTATSHRVHLSKDHEAFRLMYWERPDGLVEFANIGPKNELVIVSGDHTRANAAQYS